MIHEMCVDGQCDLMVFKTGNMCVMSPSADKRTRQRSLGGVVVSSSIIREKEIRDGGFHIVYNCGFLEESGTDIDALWASAEAAGSGARGAVVFFAAGGRELAFKHYCRGGLPGRFVRDRYVFCGERRTRPQIEWRVLCALRDADLPVPTPVSARTIRRGMSYTADLLTLSLRPATPFSDCLASGDLGPEIWRKVGETMRRIGDAGVEHADLNAHNILIDVARAEVSVLDFDRARMTAGATDKPRARLRRSLEKLRAQNRLNFTVAEWAALEEGYASVA